MLSFLKKMLSIGDRPDAIDPHDHRSEMYKANRDVIDCLRFSATLNLHTPLKYLEIHNQTAPVGQELKPEKGEYGVWLPEVKEKYKVPGFERTMSSPFGPVASDGGALLPVLKEIRAVVERSLKHDQVFIVAKDRVDELMAMSRRPGGQPCPIPSSAQCLLLLLNEYNAAIKYLTAEHYLQLMEMGCVSPKSVALLTDNQLLSLKGIGPAKLKVIRDQLNTLV